MMVVSLVMPIGERTVLGHGCSVKYNRDIRIGRVPTKAFRGKYVLLYI